jgi:predicted metal-dependent hydrolase
VQLRLPLSGPWPRQPGPVVFVRHRRARRYILRVLADGTVRVTLPRWGVKREAQAFLDASGAWIARQLAGRPEPPRAQPWGDGTGVLVGGRTATLRLEPAGDALRVW